MNSSKKISPQRNTPKDLVKCIGLLVAILLAASLTNDLLWNGEARLALDRYVPTMPQPFADLKILLEGCDTYAHSGWASFWDQVDYAGLQYNYPRWWAMIGRIGVGVNHLKPLSFVLLVVYAICVLTIIWFVAGWKERLGVVLLAGSPASVLALERANSDIIILFFSSVVLWSGYITSSRRQFRSYIFVLFGFSIIIAIKLYPLFLTFALATLCVGLERKYFIALIAATTIGLIALAIDLREIFSRTQQMGPASYGVRTISLYLHEAKTPNWPISINIGRDALAHCVNFLLYGVAVAFLTWRALIHGKKLTLAPEASFCEAGSAEGIVRYFGYAGLSIYCGTFLMGISFNYRLIFQLMALPLLFSNHAPRRMRVAYVLLLILAYLWAVPRGISGFRVPAILASWALYFIYADFLAQEFFRGWRTMRKTAHFAADDSGVRRVQGCANSFLSAPR